VKKEMITPRGISSENLRLLVDDWIKEGNQVTLCSQGIALNFITPDSPRVEVPKRIRQIIRNKKKK
jgi:hypothetical protein